MIFQLRFRRRTCPPEDNNQNLTIKRRHLRQYTLFDVIKAKFLLLIVFCLMLRIVSINAVSSRIVDNRGKAVAGATITDKHKVAYSDDNGKFELETKSDSIYISRIGYHKQVLNSRNLRPQIILSTDAIILPPVWVRSVESKSQSPSINAQMIFPDTNAKVESTSELLLQNSSFNTTDARLTGERQTLSLMGSFSRHSLVMVDDVVQNAAGEAFDFSKIPLEQVSYIEVIKGNSSVYGGSAAIGGIVHIHTKNAENASKLGMELQAMIGSFDLYKQVYNAVYSKDNFSIRTEYTHQSALNDFKYQTPTFWQMEPELRRKHNQKTGDNVFSKSSYLFKGNQIEYSLNLGSFKRQLPGPINFLELYDDSKLNGDYSQHTLRCISSPGKLSNEALLWLNTDKSLYSNLNSTNAFGRNHYRQRQTNSGIKVNSNLNLEESKLGMNIEYSDIEYDFDNFLNHTKTRGDRNNAALGLKLQQNLYPYIFDYKTVVAGRGDYSKDILHKTWRIEQVIAIPLGTELQLGGYVGTAYSQPSLFDMYWIGDSETHGNPDLKSENSFGYSGYINCEMMNMKVKTAYYRNLVKDLIQWRQYYLNGVSWKPFNVGKADITNYEFEAQYNPFKYIHLNGNVTLTHAIDISRDNDGSPSPTYKKKLVYTPDAKWFISFSAADDKRGVSLRYSVTGKQYSTVDNLIKPLSSFSSLDGNLFYGFTVKGIELRGDVKLNNILNKRFDIYAYIPQPGFNWTTGITVKVQSGNKTNR